MAHPESRDMPSSAEETLRIAGAEDAAPAWPQRVFHGPVNVGGIGGHLARWQRRHGLRADFLVYLDTTPHQNHDVNLHFERRGWLSRAWTSLRTFGAVCRKYDVFHFYFGISLLPFNLDLPLLKLLGRTVVMSYCGSDVRLIEVERQWNPYAHLLKIGVDHPRFDRIKKLRLWWHRLWIDRFTALRNNFESAIAVLPPECGRHDIWLGNTIDLAETDPRPITTKPVPVVVHAPTEPLIKGTQYIEAAIERLRRQGLKFEYRRVQGVSSEEAKRIYRHEADIIVDQLLLGAFGILAVEGMAFGKPVCCFLIEEARRKYFPDCPIVNVTIETLEERLAALIENPALRVDLGIQGRNYVERHFCRDAINRQVLELYRSVREEPAAGDGTDADSSLPRGLRRAG